MRFNNQGVREVTKLIIYQFRAQGNIYFQQVPSNLRFDYLSIVVESCMHVFTLRCY